MQETCPAACHSSNQPEEPNSKQGTDVDASRDLTRGAKQEGQASHRPFPYSAGLGNGQTFDGIGGSAIFYMAYQREVR